jgi:hypothetical protein
MLSKIIQVAAAIITILLGVLWAIGISFNLHLKDYIEPISFIITGAVWLILFFINRGKAPSEEDPAKDDPRPINKIKRIFQINFGSGSNVAGNNTTNIRDKNKK